MMCGWFIFYPLNTFTMEVIAGEIKWGDYYWDSYWKCVRSNWNKKWL